MRKVSVIIPTYHNRGGLVRAIKSALTQDWPSLEVIVVDDNPPKSDERAQTEALLKEFAEDHRVVYIKHLENKNGAAARNTGIKHATGDFIAFLDDDDWFLKGKIAKQVSFLEKSSEYSACYCLAQKNGKFYSGEAYEGDATREMLLLETSMFTPCLMFRRDALLAINGFDESFRRHQDYDLLLRFFHAGYKIGCVKEILTEIGVNVGENIPSGERVEELKKYFFDKFGCYINEINNKEAGFAQKVYAKHYAGVFLSHLKNKHFMMAIRILFRYMPKSPSVFIGVIVNHIKLHIK